MTSPEMILSVARAAGRKAVLDVLERHIDWSDVPDSTKWTSIFKMADCVMEEGVDAFIRKWGKR